MERLNHRRRRVGGERSVARTARRAAAVALAQLAAALLASQIAAAPVVVANRTPRPIVVEAVAKRAVVGSLNLAPGDSRPLWATSPVELRVKSSRPAAAIAAAPHCAYEAIESERAGGTILREIAVPGATPRTWTAPDVDPRAPATFSLPVKICVDDDEPRPRNVWEPEIRSRVEQASSILREHCGVGLRVVDVEEWDSDDRERDFFRSLGEFERETNPAPAMTAIGFSSQYDMAVGRFHLGGTRGPLHDHVLVKERAVQVLDAERLEVLVHELGHFLGATHSSESTSVMRPVVGGGSQRAAGARIQFDPLNTLLMSMMGEQMRTRRLRDLSKLPALTRRRMAEIYAALGSQLADDPAASHYLSLLRRAETMPVLQDARRLLAELDRVANVRSKLALRAKNESPGTAPGEIPRSSSVPADDDGPELLEFYVRQGAIAAQRVRREVASQAFLLALGAALDDEGALAQLTSTQPLVQALQGSSQRAARREVWGEPTMFGSRDGARRFGAALFLAGAGGTSALANPATLSELQNGSGLGPVPQEVACAAAAGAAFGQAILEGRLTLADAARRFYLSEATLPVDNLPASLRPESGPPKVWDRTAWGQLQSWARAAPLYQAN